MIAVMARGKDAARRPLGFMVELEALRVDLDKTKTAWAEYLGYDRGDLYRFEARVKPVPRRLVARVMREWPDRFRPFLAELAASWGDDRD